jgi:hypothetical protein
MMRALHVLKAVVCVSVLLATGAFAEILGVQPGTSTNPKDNVPTDIQRDDVSGGDTFPGGSGPGTRGNALTGGLEKEKSQPVTRQELEHNAEQGGGAAMAAEALKEKSVEKNVHKSQKATKGNPHKPAAAHEAGNDRPKKDPKMFRQERSDNTVQGQGLVNEQPMGKQQPANRPATERGSGAY